MKKFFSVSFFIVAILFVFSCSQLNKDISQFNWLIGKWEGKYKGTTTYESWEPVKDNAMTGKGEVVSNNDTIFSEGIKIELRDNEIYYVAAVPGNPGPVDFKFMGYNNDSALFENPEHDFPQRILYYHNADGSLYAKVDGKKFAKYSKEEFHFKKSY